jgi:purine-binding chemotaxis protein CheW
MRALETGELLSPADEPGTFSSLCSLVIGGRLFGIDTRMIREVLGSGRVNRVPLAPAFIGGVMAYRGEVVTVVSLRALLGLADSTEQGCVLVLEPGDNDECFGLTVDRVGGVVTVQQKTMAANPSTLDDASRVHFSGSFRTEEGLLVKLNPVHLHPAHLAASGLFSSLRPSPQHQSPDHSSGAYLCAR